jgi:hypothetical protein
MILILAYTASIEACRIYPMLNCSQKNLEDQAGLGKISEYASQVIIPSYTRMKRGLVNDA